ncbi:hypothetical protein J8M21_24880 [Pseudoalteromonas luteoviolacea]|uniref:hypothetical protein n=1 Tax=Pseudoalteromonas luteoviolacea TaxID=43657 RepID=UPI001B39CDFB|nr:hypothetical protein [Pseudoalteromonas luteoviolacea]MBQ4880438.1 hypothetical protein [Pseudoalteromonas luteoviolacea]MBQ4909503.1 hypothetical protein [Pseudoalteromonas luteoviolacea]
MRILIRVLTILALVISTGWLYFEPDFEPAFTTVVSLSALISTFFFHDKSTDQDSSTTDTTGSPLNDENKAKTIQSAPKVTYSDSATHNGDNHF